MYMSSTCLLHFFLFSETQTDASDVEPEPPEVPSQLEQDYDAARNEIQILKLLQKLEFTWNVL